VLQNREGQRVPQVTFRARNESDWKPLTTDEIFKGKTVVVFSLPGAFTPTCSSTHVPRYNELAPAFFANGVDQIVCISVNDAFVMNEWARTQECANLLLLPDGNGEFTEKMGLLVDKSELGFGKRSWRYSMLVRDGAIQKMFLEPEKPGDPFEVSDADTMLKHINPNAKKPDQVAILTREGCGYCAREEAPQGSGLPVQRDPAQPQRPLARRRRHQRPRHRTAGVRERQAHRRPGRARALGKEGRLELRRCSAPSSLVTNCWSESARTSTSAS
jgi:peroxiredoxin